MAESVQDLERRVYSLKWEVLQNRNEASYWQHRAEAAESNFGVLFGFLFCGKIKPTRTLTEADKQEWEAAVRGEMRPSP